MKTSLLSRVMKRMEIFMVFTKRVTLLFILFILYKGNSDVTADVVKDDAVHPMTDMCK